MSNDRRISPRFSIALVLSMVCLTSSACSNSKPAVDTSKNERAVAQVKELRKSAEAGDTSAQYRLGLLYGEGNGIPQDSLQAKEWFEMAAMQGHAGAQLHLGMLYLDGNGAPQSAQMALVWFSRAAEQEEGWRLRNSGGCMHEGEECSRTLSRPTCGTTSGQHMET